MLCVLLSFLLLGKMIIGPLTVKETNIKFLDALKNTYGFHELVNFISFGFKKKDVLEYLL